MVKLAHNIGVRDKLRHDSVNNEQVEPVPEIVPEAGIRRRGVVAWRHSPRGTPYTVEPIVLAPVLAQRRPEV